MPESQESKENKIIGQVKPTEPQVVAPPTIQTPSLNAAPQVSTEPQPVDESDPFSQMSQPQEGDPFGSSSGDPFASEDTEHDLISKLSDIKDKMLQEMSEPVEPGVGNMMLAPLKSLYGAASVPSKELSAGLVQGVENIQKKFNWNLAQTESVSANVALNILHASPSVAAQFTGELISPESLLTLGWGATANVVKKSNLGQKAVIPVVDTSVDYMKKRLPKWVKKWFVYKGDLPNKQEYVELAEKRIRDVKGFLNTASKTGHSLYDDLSVEAQKLAKEMMDGTISADDIERMALMPDVLRNQFGIKDFSKFSKDVADARKVMDGVSDVFVEEALKAKFINNKTAETIVNNRGKYMPRLYEIFENPQLREKIRSGKTTIEDAIGTIEGTEDFLKRVANYTDDQVAAFASLSEKERNKILSSLGKETAKKTPLKKPLSGFINSIRKRGDLDTAQQEARKVIQTPAYLASKHIQDAGSSAMNLRFFGEISQNPNWVMKPKGVMGSDWYAIPKDRKFGAISGKWVRKEVAEDIVSINNNSLTSHGLYKFISDTNQVWKANKILFSPATHARNIMSNTILLDLSGVPLYQAPGLLREASKDVISKGKWYQEAVKHNLIGSGFAHSELNKFLPKASSEFSPVSAKGVMAKGKEVWRKLYETGGNIYASEEEVFKVAKYIHGIKSGLKPMEAAAEAEKWLFNYGKVSKVTDVLRNNPVYNIPFITFAVKSTPRIAEAALKNPFKLYKYQMFMDSFNKISAKEIGMTDDEYNYIKGKKGFGLLLPSRNEKNDPLWLSLRNIVPWADYHDYASGVSQGKSDIPPAIQPGGVTRIATEIVMNKEMFSGKSVYTSGSAVPAQLAAKIWKDFAPPINPIPIPFAHTKNVQSVGYQTQKLADAAYADGWLDSDFGQEIGKALVAKKSGYYGASKTVPFAILDAILGLSITPVQDFVLIKTDVNDLQSGLSDAKMILYKAAKDQGIDTDTEIGRYQMKVAEEMFEENLDTVLQQKWLLEKK